MPENNHVYTYRDGKKLKLFKRPDQFVIRRLPRDLPGADRLGAEQVSSASTRVSCPPEELEDRMGKARQMAPTHHAYAQQDTKEEFLITDRIIVTFDKPLSDEAAGGFAGKYGLEILYRYAANKYLFRLTDDTGMNPIKLVVSLTENDESVASAEHDLNMRFKTSLNLPIDPSYGDQWHLHEKLRNSAYDPRSSTGCENAWQILDGFGSPDVVVGVTDDGCKLDHPDFNSLSKFASWGYFEGFRLIKKGDPQAVPDSMYTPGANHGTSCAGVIAAEIDGEMTVGAAPGCRLVPVKWESEGPSLFISDAKLLMVLDYMADKVDVMSNSWGSSPSYNWSRDVREKIETLAESGGRRGKGIVFLWAAGNENCPIDHRSDIDIPYTHGWQQQSNGTFGWVGPRTARRFSHNLVGIPGVMHVAALASTARRSHYSNYGSGIDICAPSSNSHAYYRMPVQGLGITTTTGSTGEITSDFGGTSSATPLTAGIAALVISADPSLSAFEVISILKQTASKDLNMESYPRTPAASYDPDPDWDVSPVPPFDKGDFIDRGDEDGTWSPWFGHGRVDARKAVTRAKNDTQGTLKTVRVEKTVNLDIPDADPAGIVSGMFIQDTGAVQSLKIHVDIRHTYIGDLIVRLAGPGGMQIDLHNRTGGTTDDLVKTFDVSTTPQLSRLIGKPVRGTWNLEISDHAKVDQGRLVKWSIEARIKAEDLIRAASTPGKMIPDNDPNGITDTIHVFEDRTISDIRVEVDITHTWIGDLSVSLIGPGSQSVSLHSREGREADDIQHTYTMANEPGLSQFTGTSAGGDWILKVSDHQSRDKGKFNQWALMIR